MGPVGLLLPHAAPGETPVQAGNTTSSTGGPGGGTAGSLGVLCAEAEALGAGALWAVDHLFWPRPLLECLTTLAVAAGATERVPIGSCVLQLPLRHPAAVAKQATALQLLSGGRFVLGVGVGQHRAEYEAAGVEFATRGALADEGLRRLRAAWAAEGGYVQAPGSPPVPVWIGGHSEAALARAAACGDGWIPLFVSPRAYAAGLARVRQLTAAAGRDPDAVFPAVVVVVRVGGPDAAAEGARWLATLYGLPPERFDRHLIAGSAAACAERLGEYRAAGAQHVAVMVADDATLESFACLSDALDAPATGFPATRGASPLEVTT